ncbi:MAG: ABC transporter substrate-binding protein [Tissierellia bacterium]|nr:ABC transporter substrate-binding protein [Tissierellia bacterium]
MNKRRIALLLVAFMVILAISGCNADTSGVKEEETATTEAAEKTEATTEEKIQEDGEGEAAPDGKMIVIAVSSDTLSFDPHIQNEEITDEINLHIFETLFDNDENLNVVPGLCESYEQKDDLTWVFHLRQGVKFSNGSDFNADDAIFSLERAISWEKSNYKGDTSSIESLAKVDDHTIEVTTKFPYSLLVSNLKTVMMMDKETTEGMSEADIAFNPVGTGRYTLVEHVKEDHVDLVLNEGYWGEKPTITQVRFRPISNDATRTAALLSGEVDLAADIPSRDVAQLKTNDKLDIVEAPSLRIIYLNLGGWNEKSPSHEQPNPLLDLRVRQAIYHAIDEETIIKNVMNGDAYAAASYIPDYFNGANTSITRLEYSPEKAIELLTEAGYPDGFTITLDSPNDRYINDADIAQAVAGYLEKVGITVELNLMPKALFFDYTEAAKFNTSFCLTGWADFTGEGAIMMKSLLYSTGVKDGYGTGNRGHFTNAAFDELVDKALVTFDRDERGEYVAEAAQIAADEVAFIPLHFQKDIYGKNKNVEFTPMPNKHMYAWRIELLD